MVCPTLNNLFSADILDFQTSNYTIAKWNYCLTDEESLHVEGASHEEMLLLFLLKHHNDSNTINRHFPNIVNEYVLNDASHKKHVIGGDLFVIFELGHCETAPGDFNH
ncbi:hypothetical protein HELRODRAFT_171328 [Helobdella robusta]|uniref:Uncharacterized protein n=1 Tax=Helobdella robusta TaxID=6412 RepID=T1F445_HELRO|nr:hypothetical protein HELRODRAFT_171328 [Helobdella robusta]ESO05670.1 hypothetical protein HELRODRAFT_171328 [Helobdella robusta]